MTGLTSLSTADVSTLKDFVNKNAGVHTSHSFPLIQQHFQNSQPLWAFYLLKEKTKLNESSKDVPCKHSTDYGHPKLKACTLIFKDLALSNIILLYNWNVIIYKDKSKNKSCSHCNSINIK